MMDSTRRDIIGDTPARLARLMPYPSIEWPDENGSNVPKA